MATITKIKLVDSITRGTQVKRCDVYRVINGFFDAVRDELAVGNRLEFRNFGVFKVKQMAARIGIDPRRVIKVDVPAKKVVKFKMSRALKEKVNGR